MNFLILSSFIASMILLAISVQCQILEKYIPEIPEKRLFFTSVLSNLLAAAMVALYYIFLYFYYFRNMNIRRTGDVIGAGMLFTFSLFVSFIITVLVQYFFMRYVLLKEISSKRIRACIGVSNFVMVWLILIIYTFLHFFRR